jgi:FMN phosphatase YigB (HAD superfamily)
MIKAIFFDLDGTIRHNDPRGGDVFADHAASIGLRLRDDDRLRAMRWEHLYWANSPDLLADRERYRDDDTGFWTRYSHRQLIALGASEKQAADMAGAMHTHMEVAYKPSSIVPPEVPAVLAALREAGVALGVISNRGEPFGEELAGLGLASYFGYNLAGGEVNLFKPDPAIFLHACQQTGVPAADAAYVGDNYFADIVGARRAGLTPVLHDPRGIFDDPECAVIRDFTELPRALGLDVVLQHTDRVALRITGEKRHDGHQHRLTH